MTILQEVDIWGRSWGLELQKEDDIGKGTKKRRMDNEEDNVEDEKAQSSSIEQQQKMDSGKKAQDNQNQNQRKTVREDIKRLVCDQLDLLDNVQFLDATVIPINVSQAILHSEQNLQNINELNKIENSELDQKCSVSNESGELKPNNIGLYHSIPPIISILNAQQGISPFAQRFMQINMHLPFYIVAREEELWNAAEWTILQPYAGQQKEHSPKGVQSSSGSDTWIRGKQKINESLFIFVYSLIFGKKSQSNIREIRTRSRDIGIWEENDILQYCFTVTGRIELETQLLEQEQRRAGYERWMMPDMRSPEFISIQQSIIQKLEQVSPDSSLIAKKNFSQIQKNPREEGIGPLPLRFSRDLLAIYHGVSSQHINDTLKKIQKKRSQIFEKVRPFWCEVFTQGQDDNNSNSSQIEDESFDQDEQDDEQMRKIKRKRGD
ncbi:MAG: hypothetical protein EZS28_024599 [Streblomastix strix]|uniref:Uncharacterized protein n=1 Tax=Streblomastix strix TaxID=222440 RepID=A0A5J4VBG5_9EUKA|nr:MAG: hypothetical protein EZS28_024599 [Streblomastix strix]